jgi:putative alpha-1,2-mannosidase
VASPGYFSTTLNNSIQIEATSTRRAGLMRFTFPKNTKPYLALDLTRDNPSSNVGALMDIDPAKGQIRMSGAFGSR